MDNIWIFGLLIIVALAIFIVISSEWWQERHYIWREKLFHEWWYDWRPLTSIGLFLFLGFMDGWLFEATILCSLIILVSYVYYSRWKKKDDLIWKELNNSIDENKEENGK